MADGFHTSAAGACRATSTAAATSTTAPTSAASRAGIRAILDAAARPRATRRGAADRLAERDRQT